MKVLLFHLSQIFIL